jgi:hypothetical protein
LRDTLAFLFLFFKAVCHPSEGPLVKGPSVEAEAPLVKGPLVKTLLIVASIDSTLSGTYLRLPPPALLVRIAWVWYLAAIVVQNLSAEFDPCAFGQNAFLTSSRVVFGVEVVGFGVVHAVGVVCAVGVLSK